MKNPITDFVAASFTADERACLLAFKLKSGAMIEVELDLAWLAARGRPLKAEHAEALEQMRTFARSILARDRDTVN